MVSNALNKFFIIGSTYELVYQKYIIQVITWHGHELTFFIIFDLWKQQQMVRGYFSFRILSLVNMVIFMSPFVGHAVNPHGRTTLSDISDVLDKHTK